MINSHKQTIKLETLSGVLKQAIWLACFALIWSSSYSVFAQECEIEVSATPTDVQSSCTDGAIELAITNGTPPYSLSYQLSEGELIEPEGPFEMNSILIDNLLIGSYLIILTDNEDCIVSLEDVIVGGDCFQAYNDVAMLVQGASLSIAVLANDFGNGISIDSFTNPLNGNITQIGDELVYVPNEGYIGPDIFEYTIIDADGTQSSASVQISVVATASASDDSYMIEVNTPLSLDILANDTGEDIMISTFDQPVNGQITYNALLGELLYTPSIGFLGEDSFQYVIIDALGNTSNAMVYLDVVFEAIATAVNDFEATVSGIAIAVEVLNNDEGIGLSVTDYTQPSEGGTVTEGTAGTLIFTPEEDYAGTITFDYTITDENGDTSTATVSIMVTSNEVLAFVDNVTTNENEAIEIDALSNDLGIEITIDNFSQPEGGAVTLTGDNGDIFLFTPNDNFVGITSFNYTIIDINGSISSTSVTIEVMTDGIAAVADAFSTMENQPITFNVLDNDFGLNISVTSFTQPAIGGTVDFGTDPNTLVFTPNADFVGSAIFIYTISDPDGNTDTVEVVIEVTEASTIEIDALNDDGSTDMGVVLIINVLINDIGDGLFISNFTQPTNGMVSLSDEQLVYTPNEGYTGTDNFEYTITDSNGEQDSAFVFIDVMEGVTTPEISAIDDAIVTDMNTAATINVLNNDGGDGIFVSAFTQPSDGTVALSGVQLVYTPSADFVGIVTFEYTITDSNGDTATAVVTIDVMGIQAAEIEAVNDEATTFEETPIIIDVLENDTGGGIFISDFTQPIAGGIVSLDPDGNGLIVTPVEDYTGLVNFGYTIEDSLGNTESAIVSLTVLADTSVNLAPCVDSIFRCTANLIPVDICLENCDPEGDPVAITDLVSTFNCSVEFENDTCFTYLNLPGFQGVDTVTITVCDDNGNCSESVLTIAIGSCDPPVAIDDFEVTDFNDPVSVNVLQNDAGSGIIISSFDQPANGIATLSDDELLFTPQPNFSGEVTFDYIISDVFGEMDTATVTITVLTEAGPEAEDDFVTTLENTPIVIDVLDNDNGADILIDDFVQPTNGGSVELVNGELLFTPEEDYIGTTTFDYTIVDATGETDGGVVTVEVQDECTNFISICAEPVVPYPLCLEYCNVPDGQTAIIQDYEITYNCSITFSEDSTCLTYTALPGAEGLTDTLIVFGCTAEGVCDTSYVEIVIGCAAPDAVDDEGEVANNSTVGINLLGNDLNACNDPQDLDITITNEPSFGTVTVENGVAVYDPNDDFIGIDIFAYSACNDCTDDGLCDEAVVTVNVTEGDGDPTPVDTLILQADAFQVVSGGSIDMDVLANDGTDGLEIITVSEASSGTVVITPLQTIAYVSEAGFTGVIYITYTALDAEGNVASTIVSITVIDPDGDNQAPIANTDQFETDGEEIILDVLTNDVDPDNDPLSINSYTEPPAPGTITLSEDSTTFTFIPEDGFVGTVNFFYEVCDDGIPPLCDNAMIEIVVGDAMPTNEAPIAVIDSLYTEANTIASINVLSNDSDPDGDDLTATINTPPTNGSVTLDQQTGQAVYTPNQDFSGIDYFFYTLCDDSPVQLCDTTFVVIEVAPPIPVEIAPINAVLDLATTPFANPVVLNILENDEGENITISFVDSPSNGTANLNGEVVVYAPAPGFSGYDYFLYAICDTADNCDTTLVTVLVLEEGIANQAPIANDDVIVVESGAPTNIDNLLANDTDPENGVITITNYDQPTEGGVLSTLGTSLVFEAEEGYNGTTSFTYTLCDDGVPAECDTATVTLVVGEVEDMNTPPKAEDDFVDINPNVFVTIVILQNDEDAESIQDSLDVTILTQPTNGTLVLNPESNVVTYSPSFNFEGFDYFVYLLCDEGDPVLCDTAYVSIQVGEQVVIPDDIDLQPDAGITDSSTPISIDVLSNDLGEGLFITGFTQPDCGLVEFSATGDSLVFTPSIEEGSCYFFYEACDISGNCDSTLVNITVTGETNIGPNAVNDMYQTDAGVSVELDILANDNDPYGGSGSLGITANTAPENGTLIFDAMNGVFVYEPNAGFVGEDSFGYTICDDGNPQLCDDAIVTISVGEDTFTNEAPIANNDTAESENGDIIMIDVLGNDSDPNGDTIIVTLVAQPANGTAAVDALGNVIYTPNAGYNGMDYIMYTICDLGIPPLCDTAYVLITVSDSVIVDPNEIFATNDSITANQNIPLNIAVLANDEWPTDSTIVITILSQPMSGGTVELNDDSTLTYTPGTDFLGVDEFEYILCVGDSIVECDTATVFITVEETNSECELQIPSGISPNRDGINDYFVIENLDCYEAADPELIIFNRWGSEVFREKPFLGADQWDGTWQNSNEDVPDGTYFYILILDEEDNRQNLQGFIEVFK